MGRPLWKFVGRLLWAVIRQTPVGFCGSIQISLHCGGTYPGNTRTFVRNWLRIPGFKSQLPPRMFLLFSFSYVSFCCRCDVRATPIRSFCVAFVAVRHPDSHRAPVNSRLVKLLRHDSKWPIFRYTAARWRAKQQVFFFLSESCDSTHAPSRSSAVLLSKTWMEVGEWNLSPSPPTCSSRRNFFPTLAKHGEIDSTVRWVGGDVWLVVVVVFCSAVCYQRGCCCVLVPRYRFSTSSICFLLYAALAFFLDSILA